MLVTYTCPKCGKVVCKALLGGEAKCPKCNVWTKEDEYIPPRAQKCAQTI